MLGDAVYIGNWLVGTRAIFTMSAHYNIRDNTVGIASEAFRGASLLSITIPVSVTRIDTFAFALWTNTQTIYVQGRTSLPAGWNVSWRGGNPRVVWGA